MEEFLNKLYSNDYFGFYLIVSIIVLVILFLVILFFGKKDQKVREVEATKKLQQINAEAFKEEDTKEKVEVNTLSQEKLENDTIVVPNIEDVPTLGNVEENNEIPEPVIPTVESVEETMPKEEVNPEIINVEVPKVEINEEPIISKIEEKPLVFDNTNIFNNDFIDQINETPKEEIKPVIEEVEVPVFNFEEVVKNVEEVKQAESYNKGPQIFSSVYVPEKKEEIIEPTPVMPTVKSDEEMDFELPVLKKEIKEEKREEIPKVEDKIEIPVLNDYNLDELSGESYTINK